MAIARTELVKVIESYDCRLTIYKRAEKVRS